MKVYVELLSNNRLMFDSDTNKLRTWVAHGQHSLHCLQADSDIYIYIYIYIRESVDSLCRDGADAQDMQHLSKSRITSPKIR